MPKRMIYVPEADTELWREVEELASRSGPGAIGRSVSALVANALRQYVDEQARADRRMGAIELEIGSPGSPRRIRFVGRWLVEPDQDEKMVADGSRVGVAYTQRGNIAVYRRDEASNAEVRLDTYPSLDAASADGLPEDVYQAAKAEMGPDVVEDLDI